MKKFLIKAFMLLCLILWGGVSSAWADTYTLDFEGTGTFPYNDDWTVECTENTAQNHTTDGSKCGSFNFSTTKYITYKNALTNVTSISFWTNRTTNNDTNPTFTLEGSTNNGGSWTTLGNSVTPNIAKNTWGQSTITLSEPFTGKVRLKYSCSSTAVKLIDDIVITTTASKTLLSIAVSGTPTKTSYFAGDVLDPAGLVVTGTYDSGDPEVITSGIDWTFDPETLSAGNTTCDVMASVGSVKSDVYTVTGLTVTTVPTYTAHFSVNGVDDHSADFVGREGAAITFPADPSETSGKVFRGWSTSSIAGTTNTAPSFVDKANETLGTSDVTYYAVFATATPGEDSWSQVTTLANIVEGQYVIKNGDFVLSNELASSSAPAALTAPAVSAGVITGTVEDNMIFNLTSTGTANQFYVKNPDGKYLYATNNNNGLRVNTTQDKWTFAVNTTGYFSMKEANNSRYCGKYTDGTDWRSYTSATATNYANGGKLELYKLTSNTTYSNYCTSFAVISLIGIEVTGTPEEFWKGDDFNHNGMTVTATWSDESNTDVTVASSFSTPDMATAGQKTVTVTYQGETDTYNITVQTIANTPATAYTVSEAIAIYDAGKDLTTPVYVTGELTDETSYYDASGTYNAFITDGVKTFELYKVKDVNNIAFTSDYLVEGGSVVAYGTLAKYKDTYEFGDGCYLVSYTAPTATITLNAACHDTEGMVYGTYSNSSAWVVPSDLEVSVIAVVEGKLLVESFSTGDVVPANTGVMVSAMGGGDYTVNLSNADGVDPLEGVYVNALHPSSEAMTGDNLFYRLTMHGGTQIGFWWGAENGAAFSLAANKAYLAVPKTTGARTGLWFGDNEEALEAVEMNAATTIYTLEGVKVNELQKGLNIVNGKKVMVK